MLKRKRGQAPFCAKHPRGPFRQKVPVPFSPSALSASGEMTTAITLDELIALGDEIGAGPRRRAAGARIGGTGQRYARPHGTPRHRAGPAEQRRRAAGPGHRRRDGAIAGRLSGGGAGGLAGRTAAGRPGVGRLGGTADQPKPTRHRGGGGLSAAGLHDRLGGAGPPERDPHTTPGRGF